jgi:putative hydrolase of the HAD superfamily
MYLHSLPFALAHQRLIRSYRRVRRLVRQERPVTDLQARERELLASEMNISQDEAAGLIDYEIHELWEANLDRVSPYPHVRVAIEALRGQGLNVAASSDFPVERKLERLGLSDLFDCTLWSEKSGYLKPHPEPFIELAECIGFAPDEILYVGNSYEYDVEGAKGAGMRAAHLSALPVRDSIADFTFRDYRRLAPWVSEVNRRENPPQSE